MGAKASTANGEGNRERTFSTSSSDVGGSGFNILRGLPGVVSTDRARSFSSADGRELPNGADPTFDMSESVETDSSSTEEHLDSPLTPYIPRVYTAHSLPSQFFSFNVFMQCYECQQPVMADRYSLTDEEIDKISDSFRGLWEAQSKGIKCPVCSKFVLPDDIECHLVMCLTKPRLIYNEDVLTEDKGECVICLEELNQGHTIARLPCLCIYHKSCIDRWFDVNRSCPEHPGD